MGGLSMTVPSGITAPSPIVVTAVPAGIVIAASAPNVTGSTT